MTRYWTELARRLTPYVPGEQRSGANIVKLNTNENPYPPSPDVLTAISQVSGDELRRYPDPDATALREALARYHNVEPGQVFVGNGSDEILAMAFMAFFTGSRPLQFPDISYSFYPVYCDLLNITASTVALDDRFQLDLNSFSSDGGGIIFPNPNAPTAIDVDTASIEKLLGRTTDQVVLIDEAYADFGAASAVELIDKYPNLLVSRTFSKGRSLAGLRLGVAIGDENLITALRCVKDSFNSYPVDAIAQAAGIASLNDEPYYRKTTEQIIQTRTHTIKQLESRSWQVLPAAANFVFASPQMENAADVFKYLSDEGILVRYWNKARLDQWVRISIGTDSEMAQLFAALDRYKAL
jgi:histidinol-phosphate aminotransferase